MREIKKQSREIVSFVILSRSNTMYVNPLQVYFVLSTEIHNYGNLEQVYFVFKSTIYTDKNNDP